MQQIKVWKFKPRIQFVEVPAKKLTSGFFRVSFRVPGTSAILNHDTSADPGNKFDKQNAKWRIDHQVALHLFADILTTQARYEEFVCVR